MTTTARPMSKEMMSILARHEARYGHLQAEERAALIRRECEEGRERLRAAGIKLTMPGNELMALLRD